MGFLADEHLAEQVLTMAIPRRRPTVVASSTGFESPDADYAAPGMVESSAP